MGSKQTVTGRKGQQALGSHPIPPLLDTFKLSSVVSLTPAQMLMRHVILPSPGVLGMRSLWRIAQSVCKKCRARFEEYNGNLSRQPQLELAN